VETIAVNGFGNPNNRGTKLFGISGHVKKPTVVEKHCGGMRNGWWDSLQACIPGGSSSVPVLNKEQCDGAIMEFNDLKNKGSGLGTAAVTMYTMFAALALLQARVAGID